MKIAVVTPYYKETLPTLRRCNRSVLDQTVACTHVVVADGHPKSIFKDVIRVEHVILPKRNEDNGNTPRGIGGLLAESWGFDAVAYLDADNWFAPDHIQKMLQAHIETSCPVVACKRTFHALDGTVMNITEAEEEQNLHVDTSCWLITKPAFSLLRAWFMPKLLGPVCDRVFFQKVVFDRFKVCFAPWRSVAFTTAYTEHYRDARMQVPPGCKSNPDFENLRRYVSEPANMQSLTKLFGFSPQF